MKKRKEKISEFEEEIWSYRFELKLYLSAFDIRPHQVEDVLQETLFAAWRNVGGLRDKEKLKPWLFAIARNEGRKYVRKSHSECEHNVSLEEKIERYREAEFGRWNDYEAYTYMQKFSDDELASAMKQLNEKERKVIILYYCYGHSHKEIAEFVGESYSNTRSIAARARIKLKGYLEEEDAFGR